MTPLKNIKVLAVGVLAALEAFSFFEVNAAEGPLHGRPRYESIDGKEWIFYLTERDTDWYLEPQGQFDDNIIKINIRGVSPGVDNYGLLQIDCTKKLVSAYYEPWEKISEESPLINGLYSRFCNLQQAF